MQIEGLQFIGNTVGPVQPVGVTSYVDPWSPLPLGRIPFCLPPHQVRLRTAKRITSQVALLPLMKPSLHLLHHIWFLLL